MITQYVYSKPLIFFITTFVLQNRAAVTHQESRPHCPVCVNRSRTMSVLTAKVDNTLEDQRFKVGSVSLFSQFCQGGRSRNQCVVKTLVQESLSRYQVGRPCFITKGLSIQSVRECPQKTIKIIRFSYQKITESKLNPLVLPIGYLQEVFIKR